MDKSKYVAIYVRVSSSRQVEDGYSLEAQEKVLRDYVSKQGKKVFKIYSDAGISGATTDRLGLQDLLSDAKQGLFGCVGVWRISRISRNLSHLLVILEELNEADVNFFSIMEKFNIDTPVGKFIVQMLGSIAQLQRESIIENAMMGNIKKAKSGKVVGGRMLGYEYVLDTDGTNKLVIVTEEAEAIRKIYELYLQGYGLKSIASRMNTAGFRGKNGKEFALSTIRDILTNRVYTGMVKYCGEYYEGIHEPIISREVWDKVQELLASKKHYQRTIDYRYLLPGLIKCPDCGSGMIPAHVFHKNKNGSERRYYYYSCGKYGNKGTGSCKPNVVNAKDADEAVMKFVCKYLCKATWQDKVIKSIHDRFSDNKVLKEDVDKLRGKLTKLNAKRSKLLSDFEEGKISTEHLLAEDSAVQDKIDELVVELNIKQSYERKAEYSESEIRSAFKLLPKLLQEAADEEKIKLLRGVIKAVYVDDDRKVKSLEVYIPNAKQDWRLQTIMVDLKESG